MTHRSTAREQQETVVPLYAEQISISKRRLATERVHVSTVTRQREHVVHEMLTQDKIEIERIPIGKPLDRLPEVQQEGDAIVIPVVQEVLTIKRQFILKEEIRIRRVRVSHPYQKRLNVRRQDVVITRQPLAAQEAITSIAEVDLQQKTKEKQWPTKK